MVRRAVSGELTAEDKKDPLYDAVVGSPLDPLSQVILKKRHDDFMKTYFDIRDRHYLGDGKFNARNVNEVLTGKFNKYISTLAEDPEDLVKMC